MSVLPLSQFEGKPSVWDWLRSGERIWKKNPSIFYGGLIVLAITLIGIFSKYIVPYDPIEQDLKNILLPPSAEHWLGTDQVGRDLFSRIISATSLDLTIGVLSVLFPLIIGIVVGMLSGYYGGIVDTIFMRLVDIVVAFPFMVLIIVLIAVLGPGLKNVIIAVTIVSWIIYARIVRGEILVAKQLEYVIAAKTLGYSDLRIMIRHLLPNVVSTAIIFGALDIALDILLAATLGFLGLGVQPPIPEWGSIIAEGRNFMTTSWWISAFPGFAIVITGAGFALMADGLADMLRTGGQEA
ncbi:MAG: ABC transporter permease [Anaerolineaceae bacterium]|nr:ABC transporter permease [Anaerolineaceae bacterium]